MAKTSSVTEQTLFPDFDFKATLVKFGIQGSTRMLLLIIDKKDRNI